MKALKISYSAKKSALKSTQNWLIYPNLKFLFLRILCHDHIILRYEIYVKTGGGVHIYAAILIKAVGMLYHVFYARTVKCRTPPTESPPPL